MKIKIHSGTREEVQDAHNTFEALSHISVKFGQTHVTYTPQGLVYTLVDFYDEVAQ
jgi:hypothetical protein